MPLKPEIIGLGEIAFDWVNEIPHFPQPDEKIDAISQNFFVGGVTANFLADCAKLGAKAGFLGAVGNDEYGKFLLDGLKKNGVDSTCTLKKSGTSSAVNFIMVAKDSGEKIIIQSPYLQKTQLDVADIKKDYFSNAKILHTTAIHTDLALRGIEIARERGMLVSFDLEKQIAIRGVDVLKPVIEGVDILLPNKEGAKTLTVEADIRDAARTLLSWGPKIVIMTLGADGCLIITENDEQQIPAYKVDVVDTTGAGDAFCAGFIVGHVINGMEITDAAGIANAVAACKVQHLGATSGVPTWKEAMEFRANHD